MELTVKLLGPDDAQVLAAVADGVFDGPVSPRWTAQFLAAPGHYLCVAIEAGVVVGFASGLRQLHPDKPPELFVIEVGTAESHQRRGIARRVLAALMAHAVGEGCVGAWVLTEDDNLPARSLYRAVGGIETPDVVMASFALKETG